MSTTVTRCKLRTSCLTHITMPHTTILIAPANWSIESLKKAMNGISFVCKLPQPETCAYFYIYVSMSAYDCFTPHLAQAHNT